METMLEFLRRSWLRRVPFLTRVDNLLFSLLDSGGSVRAFGYNFYLDPADTTTRKKLTRYGGDELTLREILLSELTSGDVFVDVGAHFGYYCVPAAERVGSQGRVIAVEADEENMSFLKRSLKENLQSADLNRIELINAALSNELGKARLYQSHEKGKVSLRDWQDSGLWTSVRTTTLDRVIGDAAPDVMKIDVEGAEPLVLQGASEVLEEKPPRLICVEVNTSALNAFDRDPLDILEPLWEAGFSLSRIDEDDGEVISATAEEISKFARQYYREINVVARLV